MNHTADAGVRVLCAQRRFEAHSPSWEAARHPASLLHLEIFLSSRRPPRAKEHQAESALPVVLCPGLFVQIPGSPAARGRAASAEPAPLRLHPRGLGVSGPAAVSGQNAPVVRWLPL